MIDMGAILGGRATGVGKTAISVRVQSLAGVELDRL